MKFHVFLLSFVMFIRLNQAARILFLYPVFCKTHIMPLQSLSLVMAEKGHDVTFMTTFPMNKNIKNYREIALPYHEEDAAFFKVLATNPQGAEGLKAIPYIFTQMMKVLYVRGDELLKSEAMKNVMKEKFDLLVVGYMMNEYILGLGDHFKCPTVYFVPAAMQATVPEMIGNPRAINGFPHILISHKNMDFMGRVLTIICSGFEFSVSEYFKYRSRKVYYDNFPSDRYRSFEESFSNVSLVILNSHFSISFPRPNLPNMIEAAGLQIKPTRSPLPHDLKEFLDGAENGAILFTIGTIVNTTFLPKPKLDIILKTFGRIKQRVVMKWEEDVLPGKPENVFISKWLPQDDVLAHPNIRAFISHGGANSITEAKYFGVPIVTIPLFGEHMLNSLLVVKEGWAIQLDMETLNESDLESALIEIQKNPKYRQIVKEKSKIIRDLPMSAHETAAYWLEYVIRHRGAPHLHFPGADQNILQRSSFDVYGFLLLVIYVFYKTVKFIVGKVCGLCSGGDTQKNQKKVKKN